MSGQGHIFLKGSQAPLDKIWYLKVNDSHLEQMNYRIIYLINTDAKILKNILVVSKIHQKDSS